MTTEIKIDQHINTDFVDVTIRISSVDLLHTNAAHRPLTLDEFIIALVKTRVRLADGSLPVFDGHRDSISYVFLGEANGDTPRRVILT